MLFDNDKSNRESKWNKYPTIEDQKENFRSFSSLPAVVGAIIFMVCLAIGIAMAATGNSIGVFFAWLATGAIGGVLAFAILRILISSRVLTVLYLEKISQQIEEMRIGALKQEQPSKEIESAGEIKKS